MGFDNVNDCYDDDSNDEKFDARRFHGDVAERDIADDNGCYNHDEDNSDKIDARKFHGDVVIPHDVDDYNDDEEFSSMRFNGGSKNCETVRDITIIQTNTGQPHTVFVIFKIQDTKRNSQDSKSRFERKAVKDSLLKFKCVDCNKDYYKKLDKYLPKSFENTYQLYDGNLNKFCLILRKGVYPYSA